MRTWTASRRIMRKGIFGWQAILFNSFTLSFEGSVVDGNKAGNGSADQDALVAAIDGIVKASDGHLGEQATEGGALGVDDVGQQSLGNAKGKRVDNGLVENAGAGAGTRVAAGGEVEKVAKDAGDENAGKDPGQGGGPEARGQEQEHVREVDIVVTGANGGNGGDGESKAVGENGGANVVEFESSDGEENASDGAQSLAGGIGSLGDAALLVDGGGALAQGNGGAVDGKGNICGGSRKRDARSHLGKAAGGGAEDGARVGPSFGRVSGLVCIGLVCIATTLYCDNGCGESRTLLTRQQCPRQPW